MSLPISDEHLIELTAFIDKCQKNPAIINHPKLNFFKNFIEKLGGKVPKAETKSNEDAADSFEEPQPEPEPESEESDLELDMTGVIEPDNDEPQPMGDSELEPTEEQIEESHDKRSQAVSAFADKDYQKAIKLYTEAIELNPQASLLYAKRGQVYILLNKPNACIRDCNRAIELNPDSAAAHKFRGRAYQVLGKWEEAANDLRKACKFDFDEQADEWLREVTPNARKIEEHKRKQERKALERTEHEKRERLRKVQEAQAKARAEAEKQGQDGGGEPNMAQFSQFLQDPEILMAFQDPEVAEALKDITANPSNIFKYQNNPKIMSLMSKVSGKFGGGGMPGGGMPGGFPGGFPGMGGMPNFPGMGGEQPKANPTKPEDDEFNLD